jgi:NitT/TauT family transport system permease protein
VQDYESTLTAALIGYAISVVAGIAVGLLLWRFKFLRRVADPFLTLMNSIPRVAFAPLFILWFGIGQTAKIAAAISFIFFVILVATVSGLTRTDQDTLMLARTLGASQIVTAWKFIFPAAIPSMFGGLQLGLIYSFLAVVAQEFIGGSSGLGVLLSQSSSVLDAQTFFAALVALAGTTTILSLGVSAIERRLLRWHYLETRQ